VSAEELQRRAAADQSIKGTIAEYFDKQPNLVRASMTISPEVQAFRYNVTETFLYAGVAAARQPGCRYCDYSGPSYRAVRSAAHVLAGIL
jgi:hypothetical protein